MQMGEGSFSDSGLVAPTVLRQQARQHSSRAAAPVAHYYSSISGQYMEITQYPAANPHLACEVLPPRVSTN